MIVFRKKQHHLGNKMFEKTTITFSFNMKSIRLKYYCKLYTLNTTLHHDIPL